MIINTVYLQTASKKELLHAIDQLILEYAIADLLDLGPPETQ
jgi:hypothetical protein